MKTKLLALLASFCLISTAFAAETTLSKFYSKITPSLAKTVKTAVTPPTNITVVNASSSYIFVVVPESNGQINDFLNPGFNDHIYNVDPYRTQTHVVLQDPYRNTFYSNVVCRYAIVTVYGGPGSYRMNTDVDLCN